ncbi:hypothetical protein [Pseudalkalibacillus decolorationis]|uniref:hypothetical protein n=1 Tax=Pseudalkalibacillus decolorationis TaxID=163879 RepID=UPI0021488692|nr:hypothetical protein [Pseudalkalibacillus decolorationis]
MEKRTIKEPIRKKWIWIVLVLIMLAIVPWYLPVGSAEPIIFGFPYWAWISTFFSLVLCGYLSWLTIHEWNIVEDIEEAEREKVVKK